MCCGNRRLPEGLDPAPDLDRGGAPVSARIERVHDPRLHCRGAGVESATSLDHGSPPVLGARLQGPAQRVLVDARDAAATQHGAAGLLDVLHPHHVHVGHDVHLGDAIDNLLGRLLNLVAHGALLGGDVAAEHAACACGLRPCKGSPPSLDSLLPTGGQLRTFGSVVDAVIVIQNLPSELLSLSRVVLRVQHVCMPARVDVVGGYPELSREPLLQLQEVCNVPVRRFVQKLVVPIMGHDGHLVMEGHLTRRCIRNVVLEAGRRRRFPCDLLPQGRSLQLGFYVEYR
mmetsp:Transcript_37489/g.101481  ORF Transcript_37489/g.101481 Transcript_37489/m.101481 type:complete len:286 (-) Transcript_37489:514-1371(-)